MVCAVHVVCPRLSPSPRLPVSPSARFGNVFFGDDANVPSLLSLPYLGYVGAADPVYKATRAYILSTDTNPHFYGPGTTGLSGMGSEDIGGDVGWGHVRRPCAVAVL